MSKAPNSTKTTGEKAKTSKPDKKQLKKYESVSEASTALSHGTYTGTSPVSRKRK